MTDPVSVKREFIRDAIGRAQAGRYPVVDPTPEDYPKDLDWWLKVFDAKAFLFSENGSATWLFPHYQLKLRPLLKRVVVSFHGVVQEHCPLLFGEGGRQERHRRLLVVPRHLRTASRNQHRRHLGDSRHAQPRQEQTRSQCFGQLGS